MVEWYYLIVSGMAGACLGTIGMAIMLSQKINRVLVASRRALGYLNGNSPREAWKVLDALINEEDVP